MVARVRICDPRIFTGSLPVKSTAVYNHAADGCTVSADEFCCRMYDDISTIFDRTDQIRCGKGRIHNQRNIMGMSHFGDSLQIDHVGVRIAKSFYKDCLCIVLNSSFKRAFLVGIYESCSYLIIQRECMGQIVVCTAVDRL